MSSPSRPAHLRWVLLAAAASAAIAGAAWLTISPTRSAATERSALPVPLVAPTARTTSTTSPRRENGVRTIASTEASDPDLTSEAERLEAMARYPAWSQPLDLIGDPLVPDEEAPKAEGTGADGSDPKLTVSVAR